jgi:hypothetical protein
VLLGGGINILLFAAFVAISSHTMNDVNAKIAAVRLRSLRQCAVSLEQGGQSGWGETSATV